MSAIKKELEYCKDQVAKCKEDLDTMACENQKDFEKHQREFNDITTSMAKLSTEINQLSQMKK